MKKKILYIGAILFGVACIIAAILNKEGNMILPYLYELPAKLVTALGSGNDFKNVLGWILYFILGLAPASAPCIIIAKEKKVNVMDVLWFLFTGLHAFTLYAYINPYTFISVISEKNIVYEALEGLIMACILFLCVIFMIYGFKHIKEDKKKAFSYSKIIILIGVFITIFNVFYSLLNNYVVSLNASSNNGKNGIYYLLVFILKSSGYVAVLFVLNCLYKMVDAMSENLFDKKNMETMGRLRTLIFTAVLIPLVSSFLANILAFLFRNAAFVNYYMFIDLTEILLALLSSCLLIFIEESYKLKEENDLTV